MPLLLFSGCGLYLQNLHLRYEPPENGQRVVILLHPAEADIDKKAFRPETEIGQYREDGWMAAEFGPTAKNITGYRREFVEVGNASGGETGISAAGGWDTYGYRRFCEQYGSFRAALVDSEGHILRMSEPCSLVPADRFGYPDRVQLDCETMQLTPVRWLSRLWHGHTLQWWYNVVLIVSLLLWRLTLPFLPVFPDRRAKRAWRISAFLMLILSSLAAVFSSAFGLARYCTDYFNLDSAALTVRNGVLALSPVILCMLNLIIAAVLYRKRHAEPDESSPGEEHTT